MVNKYSNWLDKNSIIPGAEVPGSGTQKEYFTDSVGPFELWYTGDVFKEPVVLINQTNE